jgi:signal transduction histidine kinase
VRLEVDGAVRAHGDPLRVRQVIRNLLRNAHRHGGPTRTLRTATQDGAVLIQVRDDGPGVSDQVIERLFEPYSHDDRSGSLGIGLAVSHKLARAVGGDLVYRREGGITVFELELRGAGESALG